MTLVHIEILKKEIEWLKENAHTIQRHPRKTVLSYLNERILSLEQEQKDIQEAKKTIRASKKTIEKDDTEKSD